MYWTAGFRPYCQSYTSNVINTHNNQTLLTTTIQITHFLHFLACGYLSLLSPITLQVQSWAPIILQICEACVWIAKSNPRLTVGLTSITLSTHIHISTLLVVDKINIIKDVYIFVYVFMPFNCIILKS